ncbi:MAG TPA: hypothetical protein OIL92_07330 [Oscillospiraceae bacterium]|nr:hypothetical protein [Oscillospiraceae bacterium]
MNYRLANKIFLRQLKVSLKAASRRSRDAVRDRTGQDAVRDRTGQDAVRDRTGQDAVRDRTGQDAESLDKSRSW